MYDIAEGFEAYRTYLALKRHFTSDYNYFKYNGKVRASVDSFLKRRDKFFFRKLSKKYKDEDLVEFFVSNFIISDNWIGNMISQESEDNYVEFKRRRESLSYNFDNELHWLVDYCRSNDLELNQLLIVKDNNHPILFKLLLQKKIHIDTIIIMDSSLKFLTHWDDQLADVVFEEKKRLIIKYHKFLKYNKEEFHKKIKEICLQAL